MGDPYDKLRKRVTLRPMEAKEPTAKQKRLAVEAAKAQAKFELVRKRKSGKLTKNPGYVGKHRKDSK